MSQAMPARVNLEPGGRVWVPSRSSPQLLSVVDERYSRWMLQLDWLTTMIDASLAEVTDCAKAVRGRRAAARVQERLGMMRVQVVGL